MRARTQKRNVLIPAKYEKELASILIYDDQDRVVFAVTETAAGTYKFTHLGLPDFAKEVQQITGMTPEQVALHKMDLRDGSPA
jgi:hypothetical protein